jgi:hypothetical protein
MGGGECWPLMCSADAGPPTHHTMSPARTGLPLPRSNLCVLAQKMQQQVRLDYARIFPTLFEKLGDLGFNFR